MDTGFEELEEQGYIVLRGFLGNDMTAAIRSYTDTIAPPRQPVEMSGVRRLHTLRHPLPDTLPAQLITQPLMDLAMGILRVGDFANLRLLEQVLIRTDPQSPPHGPSGWHVDWAFYPQEYEATPRQTYFHMVHACSTVAPGGAAFTIVPGSHHLTYAATAKVKNPDELKAFKQNPAELSGVDLGGAVEVLAEEGDLIIFNPMCLHSASTNATNNPRYVYFASFYDASAERLAKDLRALHYRDNFPDALREGIPTEWHFLLD